LFFHNAIYNILEYGTTEKLLGQELKDKEKRAIIIIAL